MSTMKQRNQQTGSALVYSTEAGGRMCPDCGEPVAQCRCKELKARVPATDGIVRVSHETKGRKGKGVTVIKGVALDAEALTALGKQLKTACGSGGTVKDGVIEIQGDHRETVIAALVKQGHTVKRAGG
ncbi:translation initiation factor Sui1 [Variovorax sp. KBW07]|uniref:translation initiation factor Sui1 n=1 Tax=Variovorax sp. KBW07 TaxID=2153358 RepID=UPI0016263733|nr:translation initiation factor Sui1 [Variovorax sp. KBW07]